MDITNRYAVGIKDADVIIFFPPYRLSPDDALMLAAYLVAMAKIQKPDLPSITDAIAAVEFS